MQYGGRDESRNSKRGGEGGRWDEDVTTRHHSCMLGSEWLYIPIRFQHPEEEHTHNAQRDRERGIERKRGEEALLVNVSQQSSIQVLRQKLLMAHT